MEGRCEEEEEEEEEGETTRDLGVFGGLVIFFLLAGFSFFEFEFFFTILYLFSFPLSLFRRPSTPCALSGMGRTRPSL